MRIRGAAITTVPGRYETIDIELDEPRRNEIMVKMAAAGMCHSDDHFATGDIAVDILPFCGGHEGCGEVVKVGPDTDGFREGDRVVFSFLPGCGRCRWCATGRQNLCDFGAGTVHGSRHDDPTSFRMQLPDGTPVAQNAGVSTFAEYTTVHVNSAIKVPGDLPADKLCLLGCAVGTGWGAAVNSADVQAGDTVIVMGVGGVGLNAVQGAVHRGAAHVIAVDPVEFKRRSAATFGATHAYADMDEAIETARSLTNGQGADSAIVTVGVTTGEHVAQALPAVRKAGTVVVTGVGRTTEIGLPIAIGELVLYQKRIQGSLFGETAPSYDIRRQVEMYRNGRLKLDELVTRTYRLDQVAEAYDDLHAGLNLRGVVVFD